MPATQLKITYLPWHRVVREQGVGRDEGWEESELSEACMYRCVCMDVCMQLFMCTCCLVATDKNDGTSFLMTPVSSV